ncbi:PepSY domain-containing protein [[Mycobacterium] crassicus]|uniref:PepSY domain-containing protein n=1 Tax=[Mycobacterium] crassicus TaxID=2872309 RepID=A0ABU5XED8_9MYCO|nr:PepSY domain-containing protein [Mycolicibacter sp. MYC098]MEB3020675.1 PepSY domain-containing protein [Mycolicibacter sp. MYC098]
MHDLVNGVRFGAVVILVTLALAGCSGNGRPDSTSAQSTSPQAGWTRPDAPPDPHTLLRAGALAVSQVPDSVLIFIESQTSDAGTWKARVVTPDGAEQQLKIGSDGVAVLVGPTATEDSDADKAKRRANVDGAHLDYRSAVNKVLGAVPNGSITELSLLDMNGTVVWDADVWDTDLVEHDVTIDAASGAVTANRQV